MRVVIAPDCFGGTLTALEAATALRDGWRRAAPHDELDLCPMADGGPGFLDAVRASLGGELLAVLTLGTVTYGLSLANIPGIYMTIVVGILLLVTIALPRLLRGKRIAK